MRSKHRDSFSGYQSFQYGKSISNQRIEGWWSFLKKDILNTWINYFKDLRENGLYDDSNSIHSEALRFSFAGYIQTELDRTRSYWNHHKIRKSKNTEVPGGSPDIMYLLPGEYGAINRGIAVDTGELQAATSMYAKQPLEFGCSSKFSELAAILMRENNLKYPCELKEAEKLYFELVTLCENI